MEYFDSDVLMLDEYLLLIDWGGFLAMVRYSVNLVKDVYVATVSCWVA